WAVAPGGHHQITLSAQFMFGERLAAHAPDPHRHPFRNGTAAVGPFECAGDALRHRDLETPVAPLYPAVAREIVGDGSERVGNRVPDIGAPVAIEINSIFQIGGGHELRLAHGARPGGAHRLRPY